MGRQAVRHFLVTRLATWLAILLLAGCSGSELVSCAGTVTVEGQPVAAGRISATPIESGGPALVSTIDAEGRFIAWTKGVRGARPGSYRLVVSVPATASSIGVAANATDPAKKAPDDYFVNYSSPENEPFVVPSGGSEEVTIAVSKSAGWTSVGDD